MKDLLREINGASSEQLIAAQSRCPGRGNDISSKLTIDWSVRASDCRRIANRLQAASAGALNKARRKICSTGSSKIRMKR
jgi:hypothetical protein